MPFLKFHADLLKTVAVPKEQRKDRHAHTHSVWKHSVQKKRPKNVKM